MPSYVSSNNERLYVALEPAFGETAALTAAHRIPAVQFGARQRLETTRRRDKTGSRTFQGNPAGGRRQTNYELRTYLSGWTNAPQAPASGALVQGALGAAPLIFSGAPAGAGSTASLLQFGTGHGLSVGQAITYGGEIRFVAAIPNATSVVLNQALSSIPTVGSPIGATASYHPATDLPSVNVFDFWSPETAVQRFLSGAMVNRMKLTVNGDFHEFAFEGGAKDLVDSASFTAGVAGLTDFPIEPPFVDFNYSIVPGNLGQAWLGGGASKFCTVTSAELNVENNIDFRETEFGCDCPKAGVPGARSVTLTFSLYERDDEATLALYQAARTQSPISVMFQLGQTPGELFGVWMTGVVPEAPEYDDSDSRLQWRFDSAKAQGTIDDELFVAFG